MAAMQNQIVAGETLNYVAQAADYPASSGWVATLYLNPRAGGTATSVTGTASGADHLLQVSATTTATWAAGWWAWEIWMAKGAERYRLEAGQLQVVAGLIGAAAGTDTRSAAEVGLDAVRAMIRGTATAGVKRYRIGGRELERYSIDELVTLESKLAADVQREQAAAAMAAGRPNPRKVFVRMGRA